MSTACCSASPRITSHQERPSSRRNRPGNGARCSGAGTYCAQPSASYPGTCTRTPASKEVGGRSSTTSRDRSRGRQGRADILRGVAYRIVGIPRRYPYVRKPGVAPPPEGEMRAALKAPALYPMRDTHIEAPRLPQPGPGRRWQAVVPGYPGISESL